MKRSAPPPPPKPAKAIGVAGSSTIPAPASMVPGEVGADAIGAVPPPAMDVDAEAPGAPPQEAIIPDTS
eukprot:4303489-Prorocentrum_lima.AAC.1